MVKLHFKNGSEFEYELLSSTDTHLYIRDNDSTEIRITKANNDLYSYDRYEHYWKYMKNTTEMLDKVEIIEEVK